MADSASQNYFSANVLTNTGFALIVVTSATVITRFSIRIWKRKLFEIEDLLVGLAWASFLALTISYIVITPPMYHLYAVTTGDAPPYPEPEMMDDARLIIKVFFYSTMLLWCTLWAVKFSLLALYRRLMVGLRTYLILWWALVVFCALTFIGAIISSLTSCSSMHAWFTPGQCATPRDITAQMTSLYYAFAVDILTDLLIMALPLRLIWHLQMPRPEKFAIGALFCSGLVCITVALLRVVQIGLKARNSTPSSSWLALWAEVEAAMAVVIGCAPAFAAFWRTRRAEGYDSRRKKGSGGGGEAEGGVGLRCVAVGGGGSGKGRAWEEATNCSTEGLAGKAGAAGIYVTRSIRQDSEDSGPGREREPC